MNRSSTNGRIRDGLIIVVCLALFGGGGLLLERSVGRLPERSARIEPVGHAGTSVGRLVRIARQLEIDDRALSSLFLLPEHLPSSLVIDAQDLDQGWPVLSIVADAADLHDPERGILANPLARGRDWERLVFASYYEQGELIFATRAGLRRHGGASRNKSDQPSLRLYFRDDYGSGSPGRAVFEALEASPTRIVVRKPAPSYATALSFEIAHQIGAPTPAFKLAQVYLNGEHEGPYLLAEHVHPDGWGRSYFGHNRYSMFVHRGSQTTNESSAEKFAELNSWARDLPAPITMSMLESNIDLDSMFRNIFTIIYCGTGDWAQGASVLDESRDDGRWFWVLWDLDHSFQFRRQILASRRAFELLVSPVREDAKEDLRGALFRRLLEEDPAFPEAFARLGMDLLNHRLNSAFSRDLVSRYEYALTQKEAREYRQFFRLRSDYVRAEMQSYLGVGAVHHVVVEAPDGLELEIDGYPESGSYSGAYFEGTEITLTPADDRAGDSFYWLVNGERRDERNLVLAVEETTIIEAVLSP